MILLKSRSAAETMRLGKAIGAFLGGGDVVALEGELGAGKTTLVKGIAEGMGADKSRVTSPTFVLINQYKGREKIFHMDWYRLDKVEGEDRELALECFSAAAVTLIEWPARGRSLVPGSALRIAIGHAPKGKSPASRVLRLSSKGRRFAPLLTSLRKGASA